MGAFPCVRTYPSLGWYHFSFDSEEVAPMDCLSWETVFCCQGPQRFAWFAKLSSAWSCLLWISRLSFAWLGCHPARITACEDSFQILFLLHRCLARWAFPGFPVSLAVGTGVNSGIKPYLQLLVAGSLGSQVQAGRGQRTWDCFTNLSEVWAQSFQSQQKSDPNIQTFSKGLSRNHFRSSFSVLSRYVGRLSRCLMHFWGLWDRQ